LFCSGNCFFEISEKEQLFLWAVAGDGFLDGGQYAAAQWKGEVLEESSQLGGEEADGDYGDELGEQTAKGDEGHQGVTSAVLEGLDGKADTEGEVVGTLDEVVSQVFEVGQRKGVAIVAVFEGVEVSRRRARATRAEFSVAMGAATGVVMHGPGTTTGDLAMGFVRVSGHGDDSDRSLWFV